MSLALVETETTEDIESVSASHLDRGEARRLAERMSADLEEKSPEELLRWASARWGEDLVLVTSFQAEGMVLLHMAMQLEPKPRVITLDTGRLPAETYQLMERVRERYGVEIEVYFPNAIAVEDMVRGDGPNLFYQSVDARLRCCQVRKVEPLRRALVGTQAWITGLRRGQAPSRAATRKVAEDGQNPGKLKLSPLASWSTEEVWEYIRQHRIPYHSLYDRGYTSIGCAPCTRPTAAGESARAGRWWWEQGSSSECGLHLRRSEGEVDVSLGNLRRTAELRATGG